MLWCAVGVVGDSAEVMLADSSSGQRTHTLTGHREFGFSLSWGSEYVLATANQDTTTRVWDVRHSKQSVAVLGSAMAVPRVVRYSPDGKRHFFFFFLVVGKLLTFFFAFSSF